MTTVKFRVPAVGVEEEYQLVGQESGELVPRCREVMRAYRHEGVASANVQHELHLEQIEMASPVLHSTDAVREFVVDIRRSLIKAASHAGAALVSAGTHPMESPEESHITPKSRYRIMVQRFQALAHELMIFGCHVHVDMPDPEIGVQVMNRARAWLPILLAISSNSPYWDGEDTGYASFRHELWSQWPLAGPPQHFDNFDAYRDCVHSLVSAGAIEDATKIYWDLRLPEKVPTIEFRVFDALTDAEDTVSLVALTRALVMRCEHATLKKEPFPVIRPELMQGAMWSAARYGLTGKLIDAKQAKQVTAEALLNELFEYIREPLQYTNDLPLIENFHKRLLQGKNPAESQRRIAKEADGLRGLVCELAKRSSH